MNPYVYMSEFCFELHYFFFNSQMLSYFSQTSPAERTDETAVLKCSATALLLMLLANVGLPAMHIGN